MFVGYENQRADLFPSTIRAVNGAAISLERVTAEHALSPLLDFRVGHRSALYIGFCELCTSNPTTPNTRASNTQALLLGGVRASLPFRGARAFVDVLAGMGYLGWSSDETFLPAGKGLGSPLAEAGAGIDVPIGGVVSARARASVLASNWDDNRWDGWRRHPGLSAGVVLRF